MRAGTYQAAFPLRFTTTLPTPPPPPFPPCFPFPCVFSSPPRSPGSSWIATLLLPGSGCFAFQGFLVVTASLMFKAMCFQLLGASFGGMWAVSLGVVVVSLGVVVVSLGVVVVRAESGKKQLTLHKNVT